MSHKTLSEFESKKLLVNYGLPLAEEALAATAEDAVAAAEKIGFPVVVKLCGDAIAHKSERNLVRLGLGDAAAVGRAAQELLLLAKPEDGEVELLVAEMVSGKRELIAGMIRDPQFGPCVVLGLGGILTEALGDVVFAAAPLTHDDAKRMVSGLAASHLINKPFRGEPAADLDALAEILVGLGRLGVEREDILSVDINPVILAGARPVAVDALVELGAEKQQQFERKSLTAEAIKTRFEALFNPKGVVIAGVSSHPGKFGFVGYHNLLRFGYKGDLFPVNREGSDILDKPTFKSVADIPAGAADMVFVCTPNKVNEALLRDCAAKGVKAAFIASAGYGESGEAGKAMEQSLVELADELDILVAGPNGQGVISTGPSMCAQIVAPFPPKGDISIASQSGNLCSSFMNYSVLTGVGINKAVSCGNSAQTALADYLEYFLLDDDTKVALSYLEGVVDGRRFIDVVSDFTAHKPLVILKGGVEEEGQQAATSHTGSLATNAAVFDGICRQYGVTRANTVEQAFEWAASFATQPLPKGRRTVIMTTVGGWGVLSADACAAEGLELMDLPEDILAAIDEKLPSRWSRGNPVDLAGGETRDTIPEILELIAAHPDVDAVVFLGLGIQGGQANASKSGPFYPGFGLDRIVDFHERQERRYAETAKMVSEKYQKPVMVATELTYCDRDYGNAGPLAVKESGRLCYPSAQRAIQALKVMVEYSEYRQLAK